MYNTYDVHYYASWALVDLWPGLQLSLQLDFLEWSEREDREEVRELYGGTKHWRKVAPSVPHDLGDPAEEPWVKVTVFSTPIGREPTRLGSYWSRAAECCLRQQSYAVNNQLVASKAPY